MHDFLYQPQWIQAHDEPLPVGYFEAVEQEQAQLAALAEPAYDATARFQELALRQAQGVMERAPQRVGVDTPLSPETWGQQASARARTRTLLNLKARATRIGQVLGLDAVRSLVNQVGGDERVLTPVRESFVALEPALLHMALGDPRYLADERHPARVLVETIAQRSFKYNDEFASEFGQFMAPVREAVRDLVERPAVTAADFEAHRQSLEAAWKQQDEQEQSAHEQALHSMQFAQERQALADRIAWELSLRPDINDAPAAVADFLYRDWSLVIAHAQLASEGSKLDPGGYVAVVSDLLWSATPRLTMKQPTRLFEVVPRLIKALRNGLDMLGKDPADTETFFGALMRYHQPVLRLRRTRSAMDTQAAGLTMPGGLESMPVPLDPEPAERPAPRKADQPWLGKHELQAAGFADTDELDTARAELPEEALAQVASPVEPVPNAVTAPSAKLVQGEPAEGAIAVPSAPGQAAGDEDDLQKQIQAAVGRLRAGDWVDLHVNGAWRRAQLSWTNDNGALFMFVSQGGRPHGMTRRMCEKLMRLRHLRPVNVDAVVERALRKVSDAAAHERKRRERKEALA